MSAHPANADFLDAIPTTLQDVEDEMARQDLRANGEYLAYLLGVSEPVRFSGELSAAQLKELEDTFAEQERDL